MKFSQSRRKLMRSAALCSAGLAGNGLLTGAALGQNPTDGSIDAITINDDLSLFIGSGSNVLVRKSADGLMIVDGGKAEHATALLQSITGQMQSDAVQYLMNTHWHPEQTGLNTVLAARDVTIFAHENTRQWLSVAVDRPYTETVSPLPEAAWPDETFYHYGELPFAGGVQYGYLRQAHTDGDMYVHFPDDNVLHTGGAVNADSWPLIDWWTGGWIGGLPESLEVLLALTNDSTVIVPAHGPVLTRVELAELHAMYSTLYERIRESFMSALSEQETVDAGLTAEFDSRFGDPEQFIRLAHQSLRAHVTPDA